MEGRRIVGMVAFLVESPLACALESPLSTELESATNLAKLVRARRCLRRVHFVGAVSVTDHHLSRETVRARVRFLGAFRARVRFLGRCLCARDR